MTAWIAALVLSVAITQQAPAPGTEPVHASEALVQEVRALRQAVEAVLATNVRVQLLMGRLQLQEARIQSLIQQNRDIDAQLGAITAQRDLFHQQQRMMVRTSS